MNTPLSRATLALALFTGCAEEEPVDMGPTTVVVQEDPWEGLGKWLLTIVDVTQTVEQECSENWLSGSCQEESGSGALSSTSTNNSTRRGIQVTLVQDESAVTWLNFPDTGRVYPGTREGNTFTFTWQGEESSETTTQSVMNLPAGQRYTWSRVVDGTSETTISLVVDLAAGTATGTSTYTESVVRTWSESDEWSAYDNDNQNDRIDNYSYNYMERYENANNGTYDDDCQGNTCTLSIDRSSTTEHTLSGLFLQAGDGFFSGTFTPTGLGGPPF